MEIKPGWQRQAPPQAGADCPREGSSEAGV